MSVLHTNGARADLGALDAGPVNPRRTLVPVGVPTGPGVLVWADAWLARLAVPRLEALTWAGLVVLAAASRLLGLASPPLNVEEGRRALEAWTLLREGRVAYDGASILTNLNSLVFILFTDGDGQARVIPALCGVALVATPLLLRPLLGGWWSLLAGLALASSTILLTASRTVSPTMPVALAMLVVVVAGWRFGESQDHRWLLAALVAGVVGVGLDTSFVVALGAVALAYAIAEGDIFGRPHWGPAVRQHGRWALAIALGVGIVLSTRFLMNPSGLQAGLIDPLSAWSFDIARGAGLTAPILVLLLDGGLVVLAAVGLFSIREQPRAIRFLGTWLLVSLTLVSLMRMPDQRYLAQPVLPLALLAGFGLLRLVRWIAESGSWMTTVVGLLGLVPLITVSFQIQSAIRQNLSPWGASGVVLAVGMVLVALVAVNLLRGAQFGAAIATWLLVILASGAVASGARAVEARGDDRGQVAEQSVVTPELHQIRQQALTWFRAEPNGTIAVDSGLRPLLAWHLRDVPTVRWDAAANQQAGVAILAEPPARAAPDTRTTRTIAGYVGDWTTLALQPNRLWQWMTNRQSLVSLRPYAIVVVQPAGR